MKVNGGIWATASRTTTKVDPHTAVTATSASSHLWASSQDDTLTEWTRPLMFLAERSSLNRRNGTVSSAPLRVRPRAQGRELMRRRFASRTAAMAALLALPLLAGAVPAAAAGQRPAGEHGHGAYRKVGYF